MKNIHEPVAVRYVESITHAFLVLRGANGDVLAHGELVQAPVARQPMRSRLAFRFKDSSLWEESGARPSPSRSRRPSIATPAVTGPRNAAAILLRGG